MINKFLEFLIVNYGIGAVKGLRSRVYVRRNTDC
jgi:hypothetical protein